ncbi:TPA: AAA family ATPase [Bacillus cereus]|nr:hypothetical protein BC2903_22090 [Bacillus cereus]HDR7976956.1 AAA family ATPase [Bacillus cereus]
MSEIGFYIRKLMVIGNGVESASVEFKKGLNVISGPSDIGKSYIFECINYMLGSTAKPKKIAEGYSSILMELILYTGEIYTLKRDFGKEEVEVYQGSSESIQQSSVSILSCKHDKDKKDNLSAFLLDKSSYKHPSYVRKNQKGETRTLSFRDLSMYIAISEDKIIKKQSPILSGQYTSATVEKSIFKLLISEFDDSKDKDASNTSGLSIKKLEGQIELLERLINKEEIELLELELTREGGGNEFIVANKMADIELEIEKVNEEIKNQTSIRRELWNEIEKDKSKSIAVLELMKRFKLLKEHYDVDLKRLNFIIEGNHYLSQLNVSLCPYCGRNLDSGKCLDSHCTFDNPVEEVFVSIEAEINKIKRQLLDLNSTIEQSKIEYSELLSTIEENQAEYNKINSRIKEFLEPQETNLKELLNVYIQEKELLTRYNLIQLKIEGLNNEKSLIETKLHTKTPPKVKEKEENEGVILSLYNDFCEFVSTTLKDWEFSVNTGVTFKDGIFYVDSKATEDYGKGYRAIIYSAFAISLMRFCKSNAKPHPGFVVLDSPLTTYKGKKSVEDVKGDIQNAFFEDLVSLSDNMQVIVLENKEPSDEVKEKIHYIEFTKDINYGRYGFFPEITSE